MASEETVTYSESGECAFDVLGQPDASDLRLRADLLREIARIVRARKLTQVRAGALMGMDQPRVSALLNGKITLFSTDRLLRALADLGQDIELRIKPAAGPKGRCRIAA